MMSLVLGLLISPMALDSDLLGSWRYAEYSYQGHTQPIPDPTLDLRFSFTDDQKVKLRWSRDNPAVFCERDAEFQTEDGWLEQKVVWVHPGNQPNCDEDTDMQLGHVTKTQYKIQGSQLFLYLELSGEPFIYILNRVPNSSGFERNL